MNFIENENSLVCELPERLDTVNSQEFEGQLKKVLEKNFKTMTFDFSNVNFVSSYFLRICLNMIKQYGADNFHVINVKSEIKKVFMISGFDKIMKIK